MQKQSVTVDIPTEFKAKLADKKSLLFEADDQGMSVYLIDKLDKRAPILYNGWVMFAPEMKEQAEKDFLKVVDKIMEIVVKTHIAIS